LIRDISGVRDATLFGQTIHVLADQSLIPESMVGQLGLPETTVSSRQITPSLEDVFVTLSRAAEQGTLSYAAPVVSTSNEPATAASTGTVHVLPPREPVPKESTSPEKRTLFQTPARIRSMAGFVAVFLKEFAHIRREPTTLFFSFIVPVLQCVVFGFAINTEIKNIPMVVMDLDGRREARELCEAFKNTNTFRVTERVFRDEDFDHALRSGAAKVGLRIPANYSDRLLAGEQVQVQVLIDGSDSQVATTALNTANLLGLNLSLRRASLMVQNLPVVPARNETGVASVPIEMRSRLLFNPNLESSHFFVPGLVGIILQLVTLFLTSFAIVRERELGTLEQLFVTPVGKAGLLLGKLTPYAVLAFGETLIVLNVMVWFFKVPIQGNLLLLLALSLLFLLCALGLGLMVSALAKTQLQAIQFAFIIMLPSVLLSGFMFPRSEMPGPIYLATFVIPVTYYLEILRAIVLRGAGLIDIIPSVIGLIVSTAAILGLSLSRFRKQLG
ncbi:MAG TPA: ABC transporter permease, partial [Planctomycetaceae bacterium]|nr:ABC transporter permease [Planctomycetaceae bacterium]